jgi:murein DD-endopeptidase MepM/ murein hydrolase activator NlpD
VAVRSRVVAVLLTAGLVTMLVHVPATAADACWRAPVVAPVADPFREPGCAWCPGNRGIEYASPAGAAVTAVATGRVTFSGRVAGTPYVVVRHADGIRVTYGNVASDLSTGDVVVGGTRVGATVGRFHFGVREGTRYLDPAPLIGRLVGVVRLIPIGGDPPAAGPPPVLRCDR